MSAADKVRITVDIFGTQYKLVGGTSADYMKMVASHVDDHMHRIGDANGRLDTPKIAVLAAVNIADEYFRLKAEAERAAAELDQWRKKAETAQLYAEELEALKAERKEWEEARNALEFQVRGLQMQLQESVMHEQKLERELERLGESKSGEIAKLTESLERMRESAESWRGKHLAAEERKEAELKARDERHAEELARMREQLELAKAEHEQAIDRILADQERQRTELRQEADEKLAELEREWRDKLAAKEREWRELSEEAVLDWESRIAAAKLDYDRFLEEERRQAEERERRQAETERLLHEELERLKREKEAEKERAESSLSENRELKVRYETLHDEYEKLKKEYNEWLELVLEKDDSN